MPRWSLCPMLSLLQVLREELPENKTSTLLHRGTPKLSLLFRKSTAQVRGIRVITETSLMGDHILPKLHGTRSSGMGRSHAKETQSLPCEAAGCRTTVQDLDAPIRTRFPEFHQKNRRHSTTPSPIGLGSGKNLRTT